MRISGAMSAPIGNPFNRKDGQGEEAHLSIEVIGGAHRPSPTGLDASREPSLPIDCACPRDRLAVRTQSRQGRTVWPPPAWAAILSQSKLGSISKSLIRCLRHHDPHLAQRHCRAICNAYVSLGSRGWIGSQKARLPPAYCGAAALRTPRTEKCPSAHRGEAGTQIRGDWVLRGERWAARKGPFG